MTTTPRQTTEQLLIPRQPLLAKDAASCESVDVREWGISHCYQFTVSREMMESAVIVPDGSIDLLFHCGVDCIRAFSYGSVTRMSDISYLADLKPGDRIFGVRFYPGQAWWPGGLPVSDLTGSSMDLTDLDYDQATMEQIAQTTDFNHQVDIFMNYYLPEYENHFKATSRAELCQIMINTISGRRGALRIEEMERMMGYSTRYLNRVFKSETGMSPKTFAKITRFQNVLNAMLEQKKIAEIAGEFGFFDQSHLLKEFKLFTGMSPLNYMKSNSKRGLYLI